MKNANLPTQSIIHFTMRLAAPAFVLALAGCMAPAPKVDAQFGDSLQKAKQAQQITPTAAQRRAPAPDATSAEVQRAVTLQSLGISGVGGAAGGAAGAPAQSTGAGTTTSSTVR